MANNVYHLTVKYLLSDHNKIYFLNNLIHHCCDVVDYCCFSQCMLEFSFVVLLLLFSSFFIFFCLPRKQRNTIVIQIIRSVAGYYIIIIREPQMFFVIHRKTKNFTDEIFKMNTVQCYCTHFDCRIKKISAKTVMPTRIVLTFTLKHLFKGHCSVFFRK